MESASRSGGRLLPSSECETADTSAGIRDDDKPRRRLYELMKSQGLQDHQQVIFMSDGGEDVRRVQTYLHPHSEHWIDWFHITMRITVLHQQIKSLQSEAKPCNGAAGLPEGLFLESKAQLKFQAPVAGVPRECSESSRNLIGLAE
jgi:hypothetical protein